MGKSSTRKNKNIYQLAREEKELTLDAASEKMFVSADKIYKIESGKQLPTPEDVVAMSKAYGRVDLCNNYCHNECAIGQIYVPEVEISELPNIVLGAIESLNEINPLINRFIHISKDGIISDDEIPDFALICSKLEELSLVSDALNLWVEKQKINNNINEELLEKELKKIK